MISAGTSNLVAISFLEQWHLPERSPHRTQNQSLAMLGYSNPMKLLAFPTKKWNSTKSWGPCKAEFRTQNHSKSRTLLFIHCLSYFFAFFCWLFNVVSATSSPITKFLPKTWLPTRTSCRSKPVANFQRCPSMPGRQQLQAQRLLA